MRFFEAMDVETFWVKISEIKEEDTFIFHELSEFCKNILSLPHSSAATERVFSILNLNKTKLRNSLAVETCNYMLHTKA